MDLIEERLLTREREREREIEREGGRGEGGPDIVSPETCCLDGQHSPAAVT